MNASLAQGLLTGHFAIRAQRETMTGAPAQDEKSHSPAQTSASSEDSSFLLHSPEWAIQLIDLASGREFATLKFPDPQPPSQISFSSDGSQLALACPPHALQVWDLRLIRQRLAAMGLDRDLPAYAPPRDDASKPLRVTVDKRN